jgi:hypothetical protein
MLDRVVPQGRSLLSSFLVTEYILVLYPGLSCPQEIQGENLPVTFSIQVRN